MSYVPDEEIGGHDGMQKFVHTQVYMHSIHHNDLPHAKIWDQVRKKQGAGFLPIFTVAFDRLFEVRLVKG